MKKLLTNAKIFDNKNNKLIDVHILINDKIIEKIYENNEKTAKNQDFLNELKQSEIIDCKNNIITAGFINSTSNLIKNFFESYSCAKSYDEFEEGFFNFVSILSDDEKYAIYKFQILNLIKNGITTFCDEDFFNLALKKAVKETNINAVYKLGYKNCFETFDKSLINKFEKENEHYVFALKNVLENTEENFSEIIKLSKTYNKPVMICGSKSIEQAGQIETEFSKTNIKMLEDYGLLDTDNIIINSNVLDKDDYQILSAYNSKLIFSPSFNMLFGFPNANIYALSKTNLIGLSSFKNNFKLEMFLSQNIENISYNKLDVFSPYNLFESSTKSNAEILNLKNFGEIKVGYFANLLLIDNDMMLCDVNNFLKNFDLNKIKSVFVNGELVFNAKHFVMNFGQEHLKLVCTNIIKKYFSK